VTLVLNLADEPANFPVSRLNGPGWRYTFWVQGCSIRCTPDCLNPDYLAQTPKVLIPVDEMIAYIFNLRAQRPIEGVTFLGGEPFDQAAALAEVGRAMQSAGLSVVTYTGHTLEYLQNSPRPEWMALLGVTDILIDGPYLPSLNSDALHWRGSSNQRLLFLTDRYKETEILSHPVEKGFNVIVRPDGTCKISGVQDKQRLQHILTVLEEKGLIDV